MSDNHESSIRMLKDFQEMCLEMANTRKGLDELHCIIRDTYGVKNHFDFRILSAGNGNTIKKDFQTMRAFLLRLQDMEETYQHSMRKLDKIYRTIRNSATPGQD